MDDLFAELTDAFGEPAGPKVPRNLPDRVVRITPDYLRIQRLPRRDWRKAEELARLTELLTALCKTPHGQQSLRPVQAAALREIFQCGGGFLPIRVGGGKTLVSLLAPMILGGDKSRGMLPHPRCKDGVKAMLAVPASLRDKTHIEARKLALHWRIPPVKVVSYETISRAKVGWLADHDINVFIADECHKLKTGNAGVTKQVRALFRKIKPIGVFMSGSITARGIKDYGHMLVWALGDGAPLPKDVFERLMWSYALDEKIQTEERAEAEPLLELYEGRVNAQGEHTDASGKVIQVPRACGPRISRMTRTRSPVRATRTGAGSCRALV